MQLSSAAQQLYEAVAALLNGSPANQQAAGTWLSGFPDQPEAIQIILELQGMACPPEVHFFTANMLLTIVKRQWAGMQPQLKGIVEAKIRTGIEAGGESSNSLSMLVMQRLVSAYAYIAATSGGEALYAYISKALRLATQGNIFTALELLAAVADCTKNLHRIQQARAIPALESSAAKVFALVNHALKDPGGGASPNAAALACMSEWVSLAGIETAGTMVSLGSLHAQQANLFNSVLAQISSPDTRTAHLATEVFINLLGHETPDEYIDQEEKALESIAEAIIAQRPVNKLSDGYMLNAAQLAASLASADAYAVTGRSQQAVPLAALMLDCLACGHQGAAEAAIEYFDLLSAVPMDQRDPHLGHPLYMSMLPHLTSLATLPRPFTSWELCTDQDPDTFYPFREHVLGDALDVCQNVLKEGFAKYYADSLRNAEAWQDMEAALFALRWCQCSGDHSSKDTHVLSHLFSYLFSSEFAAKTQHEYCLDALLQLMGTNSAWLAQSPQDVLEAAIRLVFQGLDAPLCKSSAASALNLICRNIQQSRASQIFVALVPLLLPRLLQSAAPDIVMQDEQTKLLQGLTVLIATAEPGTESRASAALQIGLPLVQQAAAFTGQYSSQNPAAGADVCRLLILLAGTITKFEFLFSAPLDDQHPGLVLVLKSLDYLQQIAYADATKQHPSIATALCQVFSAALAMRREEVSLAILQLTESVFSSDPKSCLEVMSTAAIHMARDWTKTSTRLDSILCQLSPPLLSKLQDQDVLDPELAAAWFQLLADFPANLPGKSQQCTTAVEAVISDNFGMAVECLCRQEEDFLRSLVAFLRSALGLDTAERPGTARRCIDAKGGRLMMLMLRAITSSWPQRLLGSLAMLLHALLHHHVFGSEMRAAFQTNMLTDLVPGTGLDISQCQVICSLALRIKPTASGVFVSLVKDFAGISRGDEDPEVLLSYQL